MLERQDLDALLVGALYGELSSAEEARLSAHLDSHPADRGALDDLKSAHQTVRQKVATSRIFELQLDPPQALSALLLQEAARRAPKLVVEKPSRDNESWFQRFVRSFIAHPAMAAAATLVLVVGVGSMIYLKKGAPQLAEPTAAQPDSPANRGIVAAATPAEEGRAFGGAAAGSATTDPANAEVATGKGGKDTVAVALDDNVQGGEGHKGKREVEQQAMAPRGGDQFGYADDGKRAGAAHRPVTPAPEKAVAPHKKPAYVEVPAPDPQPKDLDEVARNDRAADRAADKADKAETKPGRFANGAAGGGAPTTSTATTTGSVAQSPTATPPVMAEPPPPPPKPTEADSAWAKDQHAKITTLVKAGKCSEAVPLAKTLSSRAPAYFSANVMNDRQLKSCMQYVNDTSAEKAQRSREPAAATKTK